jgi:hypothetical protein
MQAFLDKAKSRKPFTVSVIGGSVSKGRGLTPPPRHHQTNRRQSRQTAYHLDPNMPDEPTNHVVPVHNHSPTEFDPEYNPLIGASTLYSPENLHVRIFEWLNTTFPHIENRLVNGAQGGVGAGYFGWCFSESYVRGWLLLDTGVAADYMLTSR